MAPTASLALLFLLPERSIKPDVLNVILQLVSSTMLSMTDAFSVRVSPIQMDQRQPKYAYVNSVFGILSLSSAKIILVLQDFITIWPKENAFAT